MPVFWHVSRWSGFLLKGPSTIIFFDYISECILTGNYRVYQFTSNKKNQYNCKHKQQISSVIISQKKSLIKDIINTEHIIQTLQERGVFMKKILMISGSLRKNSFNMQLAKAVGEMLDDRAEISFLEYSDLPFMNQDYEFPTPESVQKARRAVLNSDGIWIFTPEYNYQIPGVLKNLLDWLSRPVIPNDRQRNSVLKGKPVTISGVAGRSAAYGARKNLSELALSMSMNLVAGEGYGVSLDGTSWSTDVLNLSEEDIERLNKQAEIFIQNI